MFPISWRRLLKSTCYLINAQIFKLWDAVFILGENGRNVSLMVIIRTINEHNMLLSLQTVFGFVLNDKKSYQELSTVLNKYQPDGLSPEEALRMIRSSHN